jgi:hypothetical protein
MKADLLHYDHEISVSLDSDEHLSAAVLGHCPPSHYRLTEHLPHSRGARLLARSCGFNRRGGLTGWVAVSCLCACVPVCLCACVPVCLWVTMDTGELGLFTAALGLG